MVPPSLGCGRTDTEPAGRKSRRAATAWARTDLAARASGYASVGARTTPGAEPMTPGPVLRQAANRRDPAMTSAEGLTGGSLAAGCQPSAGSSVCNAEPCCLAKSASQSRSPSRSLTTEAAMPIAATAGSTRTAKNASSTAMRQNQAQGFGVVVWRPILWLSEVDFGRSKTFASRHAAEGGGGIPPWCETAARPPTQPLLDLSRFDRFPS
jgi:hypothetical protein